MFKDIAIGCRDLPEYGEHPGTVILAVMVVAGLFAGGLVGGLVMLLIFGPIYLMGAHDRGRAFRMDQDSGREG